MTVSPQTWREPSRAAGPLTLIASPGRNVSCFQPLRRSSTVLSSSTAQFSTLPSSRATFVNTCTCGLRQSTLVTMPRSSVRFVSSNFATIG